MCAYSCGNTHGQPSSRHLPDLQSRSVGVSPVFSRPLVDNSRRFNAAGRAGRPAPRIPKNYVRGKPSPQQPRFGSLCFFLGPTDRPDRRCVPASMPPRVLASVEPERTRSEPTGNINQRSRGHPPRGSVSAPAEHESLPPRLGARAKGLRAPCGRAVESLPLDRRGTASTL